MGDHGTVKNETGQGGEEEQNADMEKKRRKKYSENSRGT